MKGIWRKWLSLGAGILIAAQAMGADEDRVIARAGVPVAVPLKTTVTPAPIQAVTLGRPLFAETRPVGLDRSRGVDAEVRPVAFRERPIVRAKASEMMPMAPGPRVVRTPVAASTMFGMDSPTLPQPGPVVEGNLPPGVVLPGTVPHGTDISGMPVDMGYISSGINPDRFDVGDGVSHQFNSQFFIDNEFLMWTSRGQELPPLLTAGLMPGLMSPNSFGAQVLLGGQEVDMDAQCGYRIRAGFWFDCDHSIGLEGSYFFLGEDDLKFNIVSAGMPPLGIPFINAAGQEQVVMLTGTGFGGIVNARLLSRLWGVEANIRANLRAEACSHLDLIFGFRALGLDDSFEYNPATFGTNIIPVSTTDSFASRNRYWGGQVGLDWERRRGRWSLNLIGKVGIGCVNQEVEIDGTTVIRGRQFNGGFFAGPNNSGKHERTEFAFAGESTVKVGYQLNDFWRATLGYNFIYLNNVVRAGEQIDRVFSATRPAFAFNTSSFWSQGLTVGLEFRY